MNKTYIPTQKELNILNTWYLIDAKDKELGRISTVISTILRGKNEATYTPYLYNKQNIIVINAKEIHVTGNKKYQKVYRRHSGRPGGLKIETFDKLQQRIPNRILEKSIKGMLPKGPIGKNLFKKLKIYSGNSHPHLAQKPHLISLN